MTGVAAAPLTGGVGGGVGVGYALILVTGRDALGSIVVSLRSHVSMLASSVHIMNVICFGDLSPK